MQRLATSVMSAIPKRVPIPRNGVDYRGKVVLAPMVRSGEMPSRLLALHYGADLVWGPETVDRSMIGTTRKINSALKTIDFTRFSNNADPGPNRKESVIFRLHPEKEGKKLIFQMGTADPERAVQAAKIVAGDVAGIDVNAGCPKPFSTSGGMGAALLQTPDKLCSILEALVKEIVPEFEIGISVKIRLLETPELTEVLVRRLVATGITGLTVHCRTTPMRPRQKAIREQLKMIADVCREAGVACLMNGDVTTRDEAMKLAAEYGCDGAMIATAAETNPSCFRTEEQGGVAPWKEVTKLYLETCMESENRWGNTKYLLGHLVPGKDAMHKTVMSLQCYTQAVEAFGFTDLLEKAKDCDRSTGMDKFVEAKEIKKQGKRPNPSNEVEGGLSKKQKKKQQQQQDKSLAAAGADAVKSTAEAVKEAVQNGLPSLAADQTVANSISPVMDAPQSNTEQAAATV